MADYRRWLGRSVAQPLTVEQLTAAIDRKRGQLKTANGEWADQLESDILYLEAQLARAASPAERVNTATTAGELRTEQDTRLDAIDREEGR